MALVHVGGSRRFAAVQQSAFCASRQAVPGGGDLWVADGLSPDTNSPVDCLCLAKDRASGPGRSTMGGAPQARFVL